MQKEKVARRGSSSSSLNTTLPSWSRQSELTWAVGLFIGEGCWHVYESNRYRDRPDGSAPRRYLQLSIGMYDAAAIERFARILNDHAKLSLPVVQYWNVRKDTRIHRVATTGTKAVIAAKTMFPYMQGTDKGDQLERACKELGIVL